MKFLQKIALVCVMCVTVTGFGGCALPWWNTSDWGSGSNNPYNPNSKSNSTVPLPGGGETEYSPDKAEAKAEDKASLQKDALATQGIRSIYVPDNDETTSDVILQADRDKYYENAAYQYEIIAKYILHVLQGKYGTSTSPSTLKYEFYADYSTAGTFYDGKKIRNTGDKTSTVIYLPANTPTQKGGFYQETCENAINKPVVNLMWPGESVTTRQITLEQEAGKKPPDVVQYRDESLKWKVNDSDITSYTHRVQLNLMQMALNEKEITDPTTTTESAAQKSIAQLARKIDKLGISQRIEFYNQMVSYIETYVIGTNLITRDDEKTTIKYTDLSYYWWKAVTRTKDDGSTYIDYEKSGPVYKGMVASSSTIYKFGYHQAVTDIVNAVLGTYDKTSGKRLTDGFVAKYPTYTRAEIIDSQPFGFYYNTDEKLPEDEMQHITAMEFRNYNSAVIYPDASVNYEYIEEIRKKLEDGEIEEEPEGLYDADFTKKRWLFDSVSIAIESKNDITIDVYLRVHLKGKLQADGTYNSSDYIIHITRMNTDSTKEYSYYPKDEDEESDETYTEDETDSDVDLPAEFFDEEKTNTRYVTLGNLMEKEDYQEFVKGIQNSFVVGDDNKDKDNYRQFYHEPQVLDDDGVDVPQDHDTFHNVFVGKLGSTVNIDTARHLEKELTATNYWGDKVDFSDKYLCQDDCDFVEFIFDVQKDSTKPENYDYSFKYSLLPIYFWGDFYEYEEESTE